MADDGGTLRLRSIPHKHRGRKPGRALSDTERQTALAHLHLERFMDQAPHQVHATLLDEGIYLCSPRTMYRLLEEHGEVRVRRDQLPKSPPPEEAKLTNLCGQVSHSC